MRLAEIAALVRGQLDGPGDLEISGVGSLEGAGPGELTFVADAKRLRDLETTRASAALVGRDAPASVPVVRVDHPYLAFVEATEALHPPPRMPAGRHPTAVVAASAEIAADAYVGPFVVVGDRVRLGARAVLHAGVCLYDDVQAGDDLVVHAHAVIREGTRMGNRVIVHAGAIVGSDGFGYIPTADVPRRIPQIGIVRIEDDVEIGANSTIDRAALGATTIGRGTKIDNLVMIAHGCEIGESCLVAAQTGLAGGTKLERAVMLGGQVGSAGHLTVGAGAMVAAKSGIHNDLPAGGAYGGIPAQPIATWRRASAAATKLSDLFRRVRRLERSAGSEESGSDQ